MEFLNQKIPVDVPSHLDFSGHLLIHQMPSMKMLAFPLTLCLYLLSLGRRMTSLALSDRSTMACLLWQKIFLPKGFASPAEKAHEKMLSSAAMHWWRHIVREDPRLCFNSGILAETQEDYSEYLLSTKTITFPLHPEAALVIVIFLFILDSLLKSNWFFSCIFKDAFMW